jgi:hypothetical protein
MEDEGMRDSIRKAENRKKNGASIGPKIIEAIEASRRSLRPSTHLPEGQVGEGTPVDAKPADTSDDLPLSPRKAALLGLTSILPPTDASDNKNFQRFLIDLTDPDFKYQFPTWESAAKRYGVSVSTIKTWYLSEEAAKALEAGIAHEAKMAMPSVLRSVRLRAELTGDPHAAEFVRKVGKLGTAESDATRSFERTLRQIAEARAKEAKAGQGKIVDAG